MRGGLGGFAIGTLTPVALTVAIVLVILAYDTPTNGGRIVVVIPTPERVEPTPTATPTPFGWTPTPIAIRIIPDPPKPTETPMPDPALTATVAMAATMRAAKTATALEETCGPDEAAGTICRRPYPTATAITTATVPECKWAEAGAWCVIVGTATATREAIG